MKLNKIKEQIFTTQTNIAKTLSSEKLQFFSNLKGLTFLLEISDEPFPIKSNGFCQEFKNYDDIEELFERLEIYNYKEKLETIFYNRLKWKSKIYLIFRMRSN